MRDIIARQRKNQPAQSSISVANNVQESSKFVARLHTLNLVLGKIILFFTDKDVDPSFTIKTPKLKPKREKRVYTPISLSPKKSFVKAHRTVAKHAATTKKHLKTPIGKVAVGNALALVALFAFVVTYRQPQVSNEPESSATTTQTTLRKYQPSVGYVAEKLTTFNETTAAQKRQLPLYTWVTPWNLDSVQANLQTYAGLSAFWLTVESDGSTLVAKGDWSGWEQVTSRKSESQKTAITITGDPDYTYLTLSNTDAQQAFIANILTLLETRGIDGVDINFEALGSDNRELFTAFIRNLSAALKPKGKLVTVTLEARIANLVPMDWRNLGLIADELRIMAYDYHARNTGFPGPVAPLGWVKEVVDYAVSQVDPAKLVIGLGNYGYNWVSPATPEESWQGVGLSFERATALALEQEVPILRATGIDERGYDIGTIPYFSYTDKEAGNVLRSVWFEDAVSLEEKVSLISQYPVKGVIFWSVGIGDSQFWINREKSTQTP